MSAADLATSRNRRVDQRLRDIVYPATVTRAREAALALGYEIGVIPHPSVLQLAAVPFRPRATMVSKLLADRVRDAVGGHYEGQFGSIATAEPHGRLTWNISLGVGASLELFVYPARGE